MSNSTFFLPGWTILHNPRCSKSRAALGLLDERDISPRVIEYMDNPLDEAALRELVRLLGVEPKAIARTKEPLFQELGIDAEDGDAVLKAIAENPSLLERPIVVRDGKAVIGRPTEAIQKLF